MKKQWKVKHAVAVVAITLVLVVAMLIYAQLS